MTRANLYAEAGADMIFPDGLASEEEIEAMPKKVRAPVMANMVEGGLTPLHSADQLQAMGYKLVIFPNSLVRLMQKAASELLDDLKKTGSTNGFLDRMTLFPGPHELVGLSEYKKLEKKYVPEEAVAAKYAGSIGV